MAGSAEGRTAASLPDLIRCMIWKSVTALRDMVKRLISDVYAGKLHPRTSAGLAPLLTLQLRVIERTDFEQRVAKVEKRPVRRQKPVLPQVPDASVRSFPLAM